MMWPSNFICLSYSIGFLAVVLEDAIGKAFYFDVSIEVIYDLAIAPGMATPTRHFSNSSISGTHEHIAQNLALHIVPLTCALRVAWCKGLSFALDQRDSREGSSPGGIGGNMPASERHVRPKRM